MICYRWVLTDYLPITLSRNFFDKLLYHHIIISLMLFPGLCKTFTRCHLYMLIMTPLLSSLLILGGDNISF